MKKIQTKLTALSLVISMFFVHFAYAINTSGLNVPTPTGTTDIGTIIDRISTWILGFAAAIAVLIIIFAGVQFMVSAGNADRQKTARATLTYAVIGLIVIVLAYFIVDLVLHIPGKILNS
jgi:type IV secretory pathway VirB2 component (pilin)